MSVRVSRPSLIPVVMRALAVVLILSGCVAHQATPVSAVAPLGVLIPGGSRPGDAYRGLYIAGGNSGCCWTAPKATLTLRKTFDAHHLVLVIYVPNGNDQLKRWFSAHPMAVTLSIAGTIVRRCCYSGGMGAPVFPLPRRLWAKKGKITIVLHASPPYAPSLLDPSAHDTRSLGILLLRTFFY